MMTPAPARERTEGPGGGPAARFRFLAADDNEQDVALLRFAVRTLGADVEVAAVGDGEAALAYLRGTGPYAGAPRPDVVLLDLNMPRLDGRGFLAERRADPALRAVPVVVVTTSAHPTDIRDCYALGANCFITKPSLFADYCAVLGAIRRHWSRFTPRP